MPPGDLHGALKAVLLDVGGTLWPDHGPFGDGPDERLSRLEALLPSVEPAHAVAVCSHWLRGATEPLEHDVSGAVRSALLELGLQPASVPAPAVVRALCQPALGRIRLFPGAHELLLALRDWHLRCVVVSNTMVRGAAEYWQDFRDLGVVDLLDGVVTSMDVGFRKPHPAIFQAALAVAACDPSACVMVGNSEVNDVLPATQLGMRSIRVAIEEPPPACSVADAVATSLDDVQSNLQAWLQRLCR